VKWRLVRGVYHLPVLPIRDVNPTGITPWVTFGLIAACVVVFFGIQRQDTQTGQLEFLYERAAIACEITTGEPLTVSEIENQVCSRNGGTVVFPQKQPWASVLTSMFLHGSTGHLLFNMWSFWIFGNNVEEAFGHMRYALLYLLAGVAATVAFVFANPGSTVPLVGASGAIAATLGAYLVLFPGHRIVTLIGWILAPLPAAIFLTVWFFAQFGLGGTNTAWEAHVAGFLFGMAVALVFRRSLLRRVAVSR
jgi:membrane associated rhomboid family serine protease